MNKPELYNRTVDILVQAYLNDTLQHTNCHACAVGNLVAANMGVEFKKDAFRLYSSWALDFKPNWQHVFCTLRCARQEVYPEKYTNEAKRQIDSTGYSWQELAAIEWVFETAPRGNSDDEWMFNGLMAVIEVLDKIHGNTDVALTEASKSRFVKI